MAARTSRLSRCRPGAPGWWSRLCAALLFASYVWFVPVHLATERHFSDAFDAAMDAAFDHHGHDDADADHDHAHDSDSQHTAHPVSDHTLIFTASPKAPKAGFIAFVALPVVAVLAPEVPEAVPAIPIFERIRPPGIPPPDPLQPRAPPRS